MKATSELNTFLLEPTGNEFVLVNQPLGGGAYKSVKVSLSEIKDFISHVGTVPYSYDGTEQTTP